MKQVNWKADSVCMKRILNRRGCVSWIQLAQKSLAEAVHEFLGSMKGELNKRGCVSWIQLAQKSLAEAVHEFLGSMKGVSSVHDVT
jgi:hypothetical protein